MIMGPWIVSDFIWCTEQLPQMIDIDARCVRPWNRSALPLVRSQNSCIQQCGDVGYFVRARSNDLSLIGCWPTELSVKSCRHYPQVYGTWHQLQKAILVNFDRLVSDILLLVPSLCALALEIPRCWMVSCRLSKWRHIIKTYILNHWWADKRGRRYVLSTSQHCATIRQFVPFFLLLLEILF